MKQAFTLVPGSDLEEYPLATDLRLNGHFFTMLMHDRWLYSRLRLTSSMAVQGAALNLFFLAQKQAPIGTLPEGDDELAALLMVQRGEWLGLKGETPSPLYGWRPCLTDRGMRRLMHPVVLEIVQATVDKREAAGRARDEWNAQKRMDRIKDRIVRAGGTQAMAADAALLEQVDAWLSEHCPGNRTVAWVRRAMEAIAAPA